MMAATVHGQQNMLNLHDTHHVTAWPQEKPLSCDAAEHSTSHHKKVLCTPYLETKPACMCRQSGYSSELWLWLADGVNDNHLLLLPDHADILCHSQRCVNMVTCDHASANTTPANSQGCTR